jgi:hypothetical protein
MTSTMSIKNNRLARGAAGCAKPLCRGSHALRRVSIFLQNLVAVAYKTTRHLPILRHRAIS